MMVVRQPGASRRSPLPPAPLLADAQPAHRPPEGWPDAARVPATPWPRAPRPGSADDDASPGPSEPHPRETRPAAPVAPRPACLDLTRAASHPTPQRHRTGRARPSRSAAAARRTGRVSSGWRQRKGRQALKRQPRRHLNSLLDASFGAFGIPAADLQAAFSATGFAHAATLPGVGTVPVNVARICEWTWMCAPSPIGANIHANSTGYQIIAAAFRQVIGSLG